jgi:chitinase
VKKTLSNTITLEETVDGRAEQWSEDKGELHGNFRQLLLLKQANRHLKVSLSIGGWSWSTNFAAVAANPQARAKFVETSIRLVGDLGLDGIGE